MQFNSNLNSSSYWWNTFVLRYYSYFPILFSCLNSGRAECYHVCLVLLIKLSMVVSVIAQPGRDSLVTSTPTCQCYCVNHNCLSQRGNWIDKGGNIYRYIGSCHSGSCHCPKNWTNWSYVSYIRPNKKSTIAL